MAAEATQHEPRQTTPTLVLGLVAACVASLTGAARLGDYPNDAGPAVSALVAGHLHRALSTQFWMGPFAIAVRVPFAWLAHFADADALQSYRAGVVPCLAAAAALGVYLFRPLARQYASTPWCLLVPVAAVLSPPVFNAVRLGHPEEVLCGALAVGAVLLALDERPVVAGVALGLALATKQWALIAVAPALVAAPGGRRLRVVLVGAATTLLLYVPLFVGGSETLRATSHRLSHYRTSISGVQNVWFFASHPERLQVPGSPAFTIHRIPRAFAGLGRDLSTAIGLPLALLFSRRGFARVSALPLLAALFLARCAFDPRNLEYFHVPFLLALLAWEVRSDRLVRGIPVATLVSGAALWLTFDGLDTHTAGGRLVAAVYVTWAAAAAAYLAQGLWRDRAAVFAASCATVAP